ncbi:MAG: hypothetical protein Ta2D_02580 [Rickettsiales bacterium]|nr:MAG: hypothetical protein Ta2D_02580 [Rickettsiales bacterium]
MKKVLLFFVSFVAILNAKLGEWVENPYSYCEKTSICIVGNGEDKKTAEENGRKKMINNFNRKIKNRFPDTQTDFTLFHNNMRREENDDEDGQYYALIELKVSKVNTEIKDSVKEIDDKISSSFGSEKTDLLAQKDNFDRLFFALNNKTLDGKGGEISNKKMTFYIPEQKTKEQSIIAKILKDVITSTDSNVINYYSSSAISVDINIINKMNLYSTKFKQKQIWVVKVVSQKYGRKNEVELDLILEGNTDEDLEQNAELKVKEFFNENLSQLSK